VRFPKRERLNLREDFRDLLAEPQSIFMDGLKIVYRKVALPASVDDEKAARLMFAFAVPKRLYKRATDRNLIRRRLKEAIRLQKADLAQHLAEQAKFQVHMLWIVTAKAPKEYAPLYAATGKALAKLQHLLNKD
jgi:ribonuclease P protein component